MQLRILPCLLLFSSAYKDHWADADDCLHSLPTYAPATPALSPPHIEGAEPAVPDIEGHPLCDQAAVGCVLREPPCLAQHAVAPPLHGCCTNHLSTIGTCAPFTLFVILWYILPLLHLLLLLLLLLLLMSAPCSDVCFLDAAPTQSFRHRHKRTVQ